MRDHTNCANCGKHLKDENTSSYCDTWCESGFLSNKPEGSIRPVVNSDEIWNGIWEHITHEPIKITGGKKELIEVCNKYGVAPKALLKPKHRGAGYEIR